MWSKNRIYHLHALLLLALVLILSSIDAAAPVLYAQEGEPVAPAEDAQMESILGADQDTIFVYLPVIGNLLPAGQPTPTPTPSGTPNGQPTATPTVSGTRTGQPTSTPLPSGTPTRQPTASSTPIGQPTSTPTGTRTPTRQPMPSATPLPTATPNTSATVLIPAGSFTMGCDPAIDPWQCMVDGYSETPYHTVNLNAYRIDKYEVTNARYAQCVASGSCTAPQSTQAYDYVRRGYYEYFGVPAFANFPMVNVTWGQADAYCRANGGRLPTEAEWERAARGKNDRRVWPWGNTLTCSIANVWNDLEGNNCDIGGLRAVGSYPAGASPEGVLDMAGNASEWVHDWAAREYTEDAVTNPLGPGSGDYRLVRGGSFDKDFGNRKTTVSFRASLGPDEWFYDNGFRCVRSP